MARQLFSEKGIYWATVEDITEMADLGKGTFYKYFDSKEAIVRVLLEEGFSELSAETERAVRRSLSSTEILSAVIGARVDFFLKYPDYLLLFHQVRGMLQLQVKAAKDLRGVYVQHLRGLAKLLRPALGLTETLPARDLATVVAAYTSGVLTCDILFERQGSARRRRQHFVDVLDRSLHALLKAGDGSRSAG